MSNTANEIYFRDLRNKKTSRKCSGKHRKRNNEQIKNSDKSKCETCKKKFMQRITIVK